jgi:UDP-glucose 4-epimerase
MIKEGRSPVIYGDGSQSRDFTFVSNNVEANLLACSTPGIGGDVFNIACGERYTLIDLVDSINDLLKTNVKPVFETTQLGDVKHSLASIELAKKKLKFTVKTNFQEGIKKLVLSNNYTEI